MMNDVLFLLSIALPSLAGYTLLYGEEILSEGERLIFSFTLGVGLFAFYLFFLSLIGAGLTILSGVAYLLPFAVFAFLRRREIRGRWVFSRPRSMAGLSPRDRVIFLVLAVLILWKVFYIVFSVSAAPTTFSDAYGVWNYKAKMIYYDGGRGMAPSSTHFMGGPFPNYPLDLPIMKAWIATFVGGWHDSTVNLYSVLLFIGLLGLVYSVLRRGRGKMVAIIFTYILSAIPILAYNVIGAYADMAVAYYFLAAIVMLYYWQSTGRSRFLIYSGIILAVAMFTKNEGIAIVFPAVLLTFLVYLFTGDYSWKFRLGSILSFSASLFVILLWLGKSHALATIITISEVRRSLFVFHSEGIRPLLDQLFVYRNYNIFWAGFIVLLAFRWKKAIGSEARFFLLPAFIALCIVAYVFLFTSNVQWLINGTTINRTVLIVLPLLVLGAGHLVGSSDYRESAI